MHGEEGHHGQVGAVRRDGQTGGLGHLRHAQGAEHAAEVADVGLHDVYHAAVDHPRPVGHHAVLLAAGHIDLQRVGDLFGLLHVPVGAGFLVMRESVVLQHVPDLDRARRRIAGVGVHQERHVVAQRLAHGRNDRFGPTRPLVPVAADFGADAELEGVEAKVVAQPPEAVGFVLRGDVAPHGRPVGPDATGAAADEGADGLALAPALQIPQRGVETAHRAPQVGAGELVLAVAHDVEKISQIGHVAAQRMGRDLPVHDLRRDVGAVGSDLAPSLGAVLRRDPDEADEGVREGFDGRQFHGALRTWRACRVDGSDQPERSRPRESGPAQGGRCYILPPEFA